MSTSKPFSAASERNRGPILEVLRQHFADRHHVLEIGSGTGQHAAYFAASLPHLLWQTSDVRENLPGVRLWLADAALPNTPEPVAFDVNDMTPPAGNFDAVYSANTLHIMGWGEVGKMFAHLAALTSRDLKVAVYGPFNYGGKFTSESNEAFDASLRARDPRMGLRDFAAVDSLARGAGLSLIADVPMPANNRTLVWHRKAPG